MTSSGETGSKQVAHLYGVALALLVFLLSASASTQDAAQQATSTSRGAAWLSQLLAHKSHDITVAPSVLLHVFQEDLGSPRAVKLCWLLLPRSSTRIRVNDVRKTGIANSIYASVGQPSDIVIVNGGFFEYAARNSYAPIGLVVADGKTTNKAAPWSTGGFILQVKGSTTIVPWNSFNSSIAAEQAVQSKPMLVEKGASGIKSDPKPPFNRIAVGVDRQGNIIVAGAFDDQGDAVNLVDFTNFLITKRAAGGPEAVYALNLDGGPDAHMYFPTIGLHLGYGGQNYVPDVVHFYRK